MKKGLTLTVVLLIIAAAVAVYGFVEKGNVDKKLDAANVELKAAQDALAPVQADLDAAKAELETVKAELEAAKAAPAEAPADK